MKSVLKSLLLSLSLLQLSTPALSQTPYNGSSFEEVWSLVEERPYSDLPKKKVTFSSFFSGFTNLIAKSAKRTVENQSDILPHFNKLLHKNGTCMAGTWEITKENPYSGYFQKGSRALIIARASTTLSNTKRGGLRGFGLAGKIFPTEDPYSTHKTANFFLIDNLGGTYAPNFTRADLTNEPGILPSFSFSLPLLAPIAAAVGKAFGDADKNPGIRQVYSISNLGLKENQVASTPKYMKFVGSNEEATVNESDFRDELKTHMGSNGQLTFNIYVANNKDSNGNKKWSSIGNVQFDQIVASTGCDHNLHFHHHKFKE